VHTHGLRGWRAFAFVVPYLPLLVVFGILPMVYAVDLAFTNDSHGFVGFHNFVKTATDYRFMPAFKHILLYTGVWLTSLIVLVVALALLLHGRVGRGSATFRSSTTSPEPWPVPHPSWSGCSCWIRRSARVRSWSGMCCGPTSSSSPSPPASCRSSSR
jgi:ABC-type sugar transport system permease subunit